MALRRQDGSSSTVFGWKSPKKVTKESPEITPSGGSLKTLVEQSS